MRRIGPPPSTQLEGEDSKCQWVRPRQASRVFVIDLLATQLSLGLRSTAHAPQNSVATARALVVARRAPRVRGKGDHYHSGGRCFARGDRSLLRRHGYGVGRASLHLGADA